MKILIVEFINHHYRRMTNSKQASGLSVCTKMISQSIEAVSRVEVDNLENISQAISLFKPSKVIVEAIKLSPDDFKRLFLKHPKVRFYIHIHSNIPFLVVEGHSMHRLIEARDLGVGVIFNDNRSAACFEGSFYLPNIYSASKYPIKSESKNDSLSIVCAGSLRPMKNQVTQALAAIKYGNEVGKKVNFYCNMSRSEGGEEVKMALKGVFQFNKNHNLVSIPWLEHKDFLKFLTEMDLGMQVSLSESFNIVAADYCYSGLPMVVSSEIRWASKNVVADTGDVDNIVEKLSTCHNYTEESREGLELMNADAVRRWNDFVEA